MKKPTPRTLRRLCLLWGAFILVIIALADTDAAPALFDWIGHHLPGADFTGHFVLMGMLSLFTNLALGARTCGRLPFLQGSVVVGALVTLEEFSQLFLVHRNFSLVDLSADLLGIVLFGRIAAWWTSRPG